MKIKIIFWVLMKKKLACPPKPVSSSSSSIYIYIYIYIYVYMICNKEQPRSNHEPNL